MFARHTQTGDVILMEIIAPYSHSCPMRQQLENNTTQKNENVDLGGEALTFYSGDTSPPHTRSHKTNCRITRLNWTISAGANKLPRLTSQNYFCSQICLVRISLLNAPAWKGGQAKNRAHRHRSNSTYAH